MDLWDCPVIVTGAACGLGAETARHLAEAGAKITVIDVDAAGVQKVAEATSGLAIVCDVADSACAEHALARACEAHGAARVLVHCVGLAHSALVVSASAALPLEDFQRLLEVNLVSTFNTMRLVAADMVQLDPLANGERGVILSTASVSAYDGQSGEAPCAASKGGGGQDDPEDGA